MKNNQITIGIVIPNKNDGKFLGECLESVFMQSSLPDEIIYIDDGSDDNSVEIAESYLNKIPISKIIKNISSVGTMSALNQGMMASNADYLLFLASNDSLAPGIIAEIRQNFLDLNVRPGVWSALVRLLDEASVSRRIHYSPLVSFNVRYFTPKECIGLANKLGNWFTGTTTFYNRKALQEIGGFDARLGGLGDLFAALQLASIHGAIYCPKPYGYMRSHGEGLLIKTLKNSSQLDNLIETIFERGTQNAPELFTGKFMGKTKERIKFASLREMIKAGKVDVPVSWSGLTAELCTIFVGRVNKFLLLVLTYTLSRPFDLIWVIYYRARPIIFEKLLSKI